MNILLVVMSIIPNEDTARDSVDLMEINHFHEGDGRRVYTQLIFYDWKFGRFHVVASRVTRARPYRDWKNGGYTLIWQDDNVFRVVRSKWIRETWTQHDPELLEREFHPAEFRRELRREIKIETRKP